MPKEYTSMRDSIYQRCLAGKHDGREEGESCMKYAKRIASMTYRKRTGKSPQEADSVIRLIETIEKYLGLVKDEDD